MNRFLIASLFIFLMQAGSHAQSKDATEALQSAWHALNGQDYPRAIEQYERARKLMPENAAIPYNLGIAHYRSGDFANASKAFEEAMQLAKDGSLRSSSIYNLGNAAYAQSLAALKNQEGGQQSTQQLNEASDLLKQAFENYKRVIDANPQDADAKANAELSHRLLKQLQQLQEQLQQQQQQQQKSDDQSQQNQENQPQREQDGQQQGSEQQESQQSQNPAQGGGDQNEQRGSQGSEEQEQNAQAASDQGQEQEKEQTPSGQLESSESESQQRPQQQQSSAGNKEQQSGMTKEQVARLLQAVRDKERKRRAELARREAIKYAPVEKDW